MVEAARKKAPGHNYMDTPLDYFDIALEPVLTHKGENNGPFIGIYRNSDAGVQIAHYEGTLSAEELSNNTVRVHASSNAKGFHNSHVLMRSFLPWAYEQYADNADNLSLSTASFNVNGINKKVEQKIVGLIREHSGKKFRIVNVVETDSSALPGYDESQPTQASYTSSVQILNEDGSPVSDPIHFETIYSDSAAKSYGTNYGKPKK